MSWWRRPLRPPFHGSHQPAPSGQLARLDRRPDPGWRDFGPTREQRLQGRPEG